MRIPKPKAATSKSNQPSSKGKKRNNVVNDHVPNGFGIYVSLNTGNSYDMVL